MPINHHFVSARTDSADTNLVRKTEWNANHDFSTPLVDTSGNTRTPRIVLTSSTNFFVSKAGSDSNTGLSSTSTGAFLTIQHAVNVVGALDHNVYQSQINVSSGTYSEDILLPILVGGTPVDLSTPVASLIGSTTTPSLCVIAPSTTAINVSFGSGWLVSGFQVNSSTAGSFGAVRSQLNGTLIVGVMDFVLTSTNNSATCLKANNGGAVMFLTDALTVTGGGPYDSFVKAFGNSYIQLNGTIAVSGTPAFSTFASVNNNSVFSPGGASITGAATGQRYSADSGTIDSGGSGPTYLPGNSAGVVMNGGIYK